MKQKYTPLKDHDTPIKVLFTGYLCTVGIGYLFALIQILFTHGMADGKFGLSVDDIVYSYYGNRSGTVLEQKLNGSMKNNASEQQPVNGLADCEHANAHDRGHCDDDRGRSDNLRLLNRAERCPEPE